MLPFVLVLIAGYMGWDQFERPKPSTDRIGQGDQVLSRAIDEGKRGVQAEGEGIVIKILPDDDEGSRHQRFILRLPSGQTVLVAHNIDLAPRISSLKKGEAIAFYGQYEWNAKGGVVHWTHRDPQGRHVAGWLKHKGQIYQ